MSIARPTTQGGSIAVSDSDQLATLDISGLPVGTVVWNEDVGAPFKLTASDRTAITLDPTDGYDSGVWTFANATFTGFEDCTLLISLVGEGADGNASFGGAYTIDTVDSATEVEVTPSPDGMTTAPIAGSATLFSDALVDDSVVSANGTIGVRWVIVSSAIDPVAVSASLSDEYDSITTLVAPSQNLDITGLSGDTDGDYEFWFDFLVAADAANVISLQPEQLATNQSGEVIYSAGGTPGGLDTTIMYIGANTDAGNAIRMAGHGYLTSKSGRNRIFDCVANYTTSVKIQFKSTSTWSGTSTVITNLRFHSSVATTGFSTGSYVRLRKMRNLT